MSIRSQGTMLFTSILILVACTVILQLWLLTVSMEALLSHQTGTLIPAAAGATAILIVNAGLLMYVFRFDKEVRKRGEGSNRPPEGGDDCLLSAPRYTSSRIRVIG